MDKEKFTQCVLAAEGSMYRMAKSLLYRDEDCADAMQNAILQAWQYRDSLKEESSFRGWLLKILVNECYQLLRHRSRRESWEQGLGGDRAAEHPGKEEFTEEGRLGKQGGLEGRPPGRADAAIEYSELYLAIRELKELYRIPFVLFYVEGFSHHEIGEIMGLTEAAVKTRLFRARQLLRTKLRGIYQYD